MNERLIDETSSIGAIWPPTEASHNRIRGFYDRAVDTKSDTLELIEYFDEFRHVVNNHENVDRLSIRTVASLGAISMMNKAGIPLEAAMPIKGHDDMMVVYTAWNKPDRQTDAVRLSSYVKLLHDIVKTPREHRDRSQLLGAQGFTPKTLNNITDDDFIKRLVPSFEQLYRSFGYDYNQVESLLLNKGNSVAYIEDDNGIVSTCLAERLSVDIQNLGTLEMAEITEAFTRSEDRGKGLYKNISGYLIQQLIRDSDQPLDIIYGENNLAMPSGLAAAHKNGRTFSNFNRNSLHISQLNFGILQQNFKVIDGSETRKYNDFVLSYVTLEDQTNA